MMSADELLHAALTLTTKERAKLAHDLLRSPTGRQTRMRMRLGSQKSSVVHANSTTVPLSPWTGNRPVSVSPGDCASVVREG